MGWLLRFVFLSLFVSLCITLSAQQVQECSIIGEIKVVRQGLPNKRIEVSLESRGARMASVYSDDEGKFSFGGLQPGPYYVVINDDEFQSVSQAIAINPLMDCISFVPISLTPKSEVVKGAAPPGRPGANAHMLDNSTDGRPGPPVDGGNPYLTDQSDIKQYPANALKEFDAGVRADQKHHAADAIGHYQKALKIAPGFYAARNNLGSVLLNQGNFGAAEMQFVKVIKDHPNDGAAYFNLGNVQLVTGRYEEAGRTLRDGLQKQPNSAFGIFLLGSYLQQTRQNAEAEKALRRALDLDPNLAKAHLALVNVYLQERRFPEAAQELDQFLKIAPNDPFAPKAREVLHKVKVQMSRDASDGVHP
jgi:Flp pilus assembly protein TadD